MSTTPKLIAAAYAKGYKAGRRRVQSEIVTENRARDRQAFIDAAYIALLPFVFSPGFAWGTQQGDKHVPYSSIEQRLDFAYKMARQSFDHRIPR